MSTPISPNPRDESDLSLILAQVIPGTSLDTTPPPAATASTIATIPASEIGQATVTVDPSSGLAPNLQLPLILAQGGGVAGAFFTAVFILGAAGIIWLLNTVIRICDPNKILVISGRDYQFNGRKVGYRVEFGGQTYCIPLLETVQVMDMRTMPVALEIRNAYAKGGTPLNIQAIANVKVSNHPTIVRNAIERFLGRNPKEIRRVARETLEGNLRGVVATLTPEQLNEDRLEFADRIAKDVKDDLAKLGLQLDTLKIQSVSDDVGYLDDIGTRQIAIVIRDAEIAESNAFAEADSIEAECRRKAEVAETEAESLIQEKRNELRRIKADLEKQAKSEEERTIAAAQEARAQAQEQLQAVRAELERIRLQVEQVLPAEANRQARVFQAQGEAAAFAADARAAAEANQLLGQVWHDLGPSAAELFVIQRLDMILEQAAKVSERLHLSNISAIDSGDGKALAGLVNAYPQVVQQFLRQVEETLQIDLTGATVPPPPPMVPPTATRSQSQ
ncbi:MAG: flotillin family protein [Prochlorothrix sp.]